MTLQELLTLSKLKSVQLIAGAKGADVTVSGSRHAGQSEMVEWMRTGELFCSQPDMS